MDKINSNPQLTMRLSKDKKLYYQEVARLDGYKSLTTWIKKQCDERAKIVKSIK